MGKTNIEWADETWPVTRGCTRVSAGCERCYAESMAARIIRMGLGKPTKYDGLVKLVKRGDRSEPRWTGTARFCPEELATPLRMRSKRRIFVSSMSDLFHDDITNEQIAAVFGVMAACPQHTFMVLTKRARRMREWFEWATRHGDGYDSMRFGPSALLTCAWEACAGDSLEEWDIGLDDLPSPERFGTTWPLPNVQIGVSVENQAAADERIPELLRTLAAVRWISAEPLLGPLMLQGDDPAPAMRSRMYLRGVAGDRRLDLVIAGCESGPGARPAEVAWYRSLRDQCAAAGVAFFLKQAREQGRNPPTDVSAPRPPVEEGIGSHRKPGGIIGAPYLDGVQHLDLPGESDA